MSGLSEVNVNVQTDEAFLRISIHRIIYRKAIPISRSMGNLGIYKLNLVTKANSIPKFRIDKIIKRPEVI